LPKAGDFYNGGLLGYCIRRALLTTGFVVYLLQFCLSTFVHRLLYTSTTTSAAVAVAVADKNLFFSINQAQTHLNHLNSPDNGHCLLFTSTTTSADVAVAVADVEKNLFFHLEELTQVNRSPQPTLKCGLETGALCITFPSLHYIFR